MATSSKNSDFQIMVVEDQKDQSRMISYILKVHEYRVMSAVDGERALELIHSGVRPDLLITDVIMPVLDGVALIKEVRRLKMNLPIVVMSSKEKTSELSKSNQLGEVEYLVKPFAPIDLLNHIEKILASKNSKLKAAK